MWPSSNVVMVRPTGFGFNPETAETNRFQSNESSSQAMAEHAGLVQQLASAGVGVTLWESPGGSKTPDAVFLNNWFSTHPDGLGIVYPMFNKNRAAEVEVSNLRSLGASEIFDLRELADEGEALEGTGSLVFDHAAKAAYCAESKRSSLRLAKVVCERIGYRLVAYTTDDGSGIPVYHTNVVMAIGPDWAVWCAEVVVEREKVAEEIQASRSVVVEISIAQMNQFAGNMIGVMGESGPGIVCSKVAHQSLLPQQIEALESVATLIVAPIPSIETCGGGSVRCCIAEDFFNATR